MEVLMQGKENALEITISHNPDHPAEARTSQEKAGAPLYLLCGLVGAGFSAFFGIRAWKTAKAFRQQREAAKWG